MEMKQKLEFMERLRNTFPAKDTFAEEPRCSVSDIMDKFNMSSEEVWEYVIELSHDALIDNNGGELRFNNSLAEDLMEIMLLNAFATTECKMPDMKIGFVMKVIHGMYRDDNFCAGKLAEMNNQIHNNKNYLDTVKEIMECI
jgi:hypothetical protein